MSNICSKCQSPTKRTSTLSGVSLVCESCKKSKDSGYNSTRVGNAGIHPALAKRYDEINASANSAKPNGDKYRSSKESEVSKGEDWPEIPGYELVEPIGKGAMGSVFRAIHILSKRESAVKVLACELAARDDLVARFEREIAALRSFRHRNVISIFESGSFGDTHFYAMEYVRGTTLRKHVKHGALDPKIAILFSRQIVQAISAAHLRGIIHRDLKPENILIESDPGAVLTGEERLVLVDFGLAGILNEGADPHPNLTHSRVTMGTVNYMAPEQHVDAKRVDVRTDLYACGVILYECLTGDLPLGRFALPREKGARVPESVDHCLVKALARSAGERYQSADMFDQDLAKIQSEIESGDFPVAERNPSIDSQSRISSLETTFPTKWMKSPPWLARNLLKVSAALFVACLFSGVFIATRPAREVVISKDSVAPIFGRSEFEAPVPVFFNTKGDSSAVLSSVADAQLRSWQADSPAWSFNNSRIGYFAKQGETERLRRDFSFGLSPREMPSGQSISFSSQFSFESLEISNANLKRANQILGAGPVAAAGGVFLVDKSGRRAIGMVVLDDGSCGLTVVSRDGRVLKETGPLTGKCKTPHLGRALELKIICNPNQNECSGFAGSQQIDKQKIEKLKSVTWYPGIACRNLNCLFESGKT